MLKIPLSTAPKGCRATVSNIVPQYDQDPIAQRLKELGFIPGESLCVIARTPFKAGPIVVKIGLARFALRQSEAARIIIIQDHF